MTRRRTRWTSCRWPATTRFRPRLPAGVWFRVLGRLGVRGPGWPRYGSDQSSDAPWHFCAWGHPDHVVGPADDDPGRFCVWGRSGSCKWNSPGHLRAEGGRGIGC